MDKFQNTNWQMRNQIDLIGKRGGTRLLIHNYPELMIEWGWEAWDIWKKKKKTCRCFPVPGGASRNGSNSVPHHIHTKMPSCMPISINTHSHTHTLTIPTWKYPWECFSFIQHSDHIRQCFLCLNLSAWTLIAWGRWNNKKQIYFSLDGTK